MTYRFINDPNDTDQKHQKHCLKISSLLGNISPGLGGKPSSDSCKGPSCGTRMSVLWLAPLNDGKQSQQNSQKDCLRMSCSLTREASPPEWTLSTLFENKEKPPDCLWQSQIYIALCMYVFMCQDYAFQQIRNWKHIIVLTYNDTHYNR